MSDYGPPPGPSGPPGPPGSPFGPPPGASSAQAPAPAGAHAGAAQQITILSYAAGVLGVLSFVWGFLDWFGGGSLGVSGYSGLGGPGGAVVGLALVAGLLAAATTFEKKPLGTAPAAIAVAGLLVAFGALVGHGDTAGTPADTKIGLILSFITAIVQAAVLVAAWLMTTGKLAAFGGGSSSPSAGQWQGNTQQPGPQGPGPQGQFGGFAGEQGQFGPPPGYGPPSSQEPAPSYGPPPGPPSGYGPPPSQGSAPSYGPPSQESAPSYGPPSQESAPSYGPPSGPPSGPPAGYGSPRPSSPPPASPPPASPPPASQQPTSNEDDASRTQVLPRFQGNQNSTQQGIPIFDPQSRPDDRPGEEPHGR